MIRIHTKTVAQATAGKHWRVLLTVGATNSQCAGWTKSTEEYLDKSEGTRRCEDSVIVPVPVVQRPLRCVMATSLSAWCARAMQLSTDIRGEHMCFDCSATAETGSATAVGMAAGTAVKA